MTKNTVSVVIPIWNSGRELIDAVQSILDQDYQYFDIILCVDPSQSFTIKYLKMLPNDVRIKIIYNKKKLGLKKSLDKAIKLSNAQYIARMDADDFSFPQRLSSQVKYISKLDLDIIGCGYINHNTISNNKKVVLLPESEDFIKIMMFSFVPFLHPSVMFRKEFFTKNKLSYQNSGANYAEDLALWHKFYYYGAKFGNCQQILLKYNESPSSLSFNNTKVLSETYKLRKLFYQNHKNDLHNAFQKIISIKRESSSEEFIIRAIFNFILIGNFKFLKFIINLNKLTLLKIFASEFLAYLKSKRIS